MPELPEVETIVRSLAPRLEGRRILRAEIYSDLVVRGDRLQIAGNLTGRTIRAVERRGKFIVVTLDHGVLGIHLGMTGKLLADAPPGAHTRARFFLDDGELLYDDIRMFGKLEWDVTMPARIEGLGPEPLRITAAGFVDRLRARRSILKPLLLNQSFLRGLGNIYVDEALFLARIHPRATASRLSAARALRLHQAIVEVLTLAIEHRGSSISDYVDGQGRQGSFQLLHQVYGKEGQPCSRCGAPIRRILVAQRGTHYCPRCQRP
ncbi:MAG: bifunctional DNA-formamidopyrimidine glycosylase/DNA-(apurinic or apyrimidinic site) lyase [Acidobacteria bacterium]|nr:bifunctional DNA-formamidopyrimidine glycosylase/DNA-(apurinic or apyrimidinic site) lyase [Acidobacteriota bacterium]